MISQIHRVRKHTDKCQGLRVEGWGLGERGEGDLVFNVDRVSV